MKKITIISLHLNYGGIEKYISSLCKMLQDEYKINLIITYKMNEKPSFNFSNKIDIKYLIDGKSNKEEIKQAIKHKNIIKIISEGFKSIKILFLKKVRTKKAIKELECDYVITTRLYETKMVNKYLKNSKIKKIATEHNYPTKKYLKTLSKNLKHYDKLIVVNEEIESLYKEYLGTKVTNIPNFIEQESEEHSKLKNKQLIAVGRFEPEKGFLDLIDVMKLVTKIDKEIKLTLIGDGSEKKLILDKINECGLKDNINLTGYLNSKEIEYHMLNASLYVMTSITESFGLVLLEAMNMGLPIISFDSASGPKELLKNDNGILIKNRDKKEMANKIIELLNNKKILKEYQQKSLSNIKNYTLENTKKNWEKLFNELDKKSNKKVLFISSTGGHLNELLMLNSMLYKYKYQLITEKTDSSKNLKKKYGHKNTHFLIYGTRKKKLIYPFVLTINTIISFIYYLRFRPKYIVTTGAHTAGPICCIGKIFGSKIIFIETFANRNTKSATGKIVYKFADLFIVQWKEMKKQYKDSIYGGWIY